MGRITVEILSDAVTTTTRREEEGSMGMTLHFNPILLSALQQEALSLTLQEEGREAVIQALQGLTFGDPEQIEALIATI
jgi:hypothetical protein